MYQTQENNSLFSPLVVILVGCITICGLGLLGWVINQRFLSTPTEDAELTVALEAPVVSEPEISTPPITTVMPAAPVKEIVTPAPLAIPEPVEQPTPQPQIPPAVIEPEPTAEFTNAEDIKAFLYEAKLTGVGPKGIVLNEEFYEWGSYIDESQTVKLLSKTDRLIYFEAFGQKYMRRF